MDETYVRVEGAWKYLYRAVDKAGATVAVRRGAVLKIESGASFRRRWQAARIGQVGGIDPRRGLSRGGRLPSRLDSNLAFWYRRDIYQWRRAMPDNAYGSEVGAAMAGTILQPRASAGPELVKVSMNFSPQTIAVLRELARKSGVTMTEIMRRSIGFQRFLTQEIDAGGSLLIKDRKGKMKQVVLP